MNLKATASLGLFFLDRGGLKAVTDFRTVLNAGLAVKSGKAGIDTLTAPAVLDAVQNVLSILVAAAADPSARANVVALIQSL